MTSEIGSELELPKTYWTTISHRSHRAASPGPTYAHGDDKVLRSAFEAEESRHGQRAEVGDQRLDHEDDGNYRQLE